ncbi:hypothetical protein LQ042_13810, partial [Enterococcus faecium]|nr:hypothetical protein [Enterococcus faecium]
RLIVKDNRNSIRKEVLHLIKFVKKTVAIPTAQFQEKHDLEPKKNEFELTHNREVKKERSRDQGMSL